MGIYTTPNNNNANVSPADVQRASDPSTRVPGRVVKGRPQLGVDAYYVERDDGLFDGPYTSPEQAFQAAQSFNAVPRTTLDANQVNEDYFSGTLDERTAYDNAVNGTPEQRAKFAEDQSAFDYGTDLFGGATLTRDGQPLVKPPQKPGLLASGGPLPDKPGALAAADRKAAEIRAAQAGLVTGHNDLNNGWLNAYTGNVNDYRNALGGISLPDSVAAGAKADPASIAAQQQALDQLLGIANGSLDVHTNPEDLARQTQAADKWWGLTDTEMTAAERFIMEQARGAEERDRRAAMDAALRNLSARGQLGSGAEIGAMLGAGQTTSQNRLLSDLGAQANAIQRSQQALGMYSNLATSMRNASDAMSTGNADRRLGGSSAAGGVAGQMRGQSFNEQFFPGQAADQRAKEQADLEKEKADKTLAAGRDLAGAGWGVNEANFGADSGLVTLDRNQQTEQWAREKEARDAKNQAIRDAWAIREGKDAIMGIYR